MLSTCGVCGANLGLIKFHCADGLICRECYDLASQSCTRTVRRMTLDEVRDAVEHRRGQLDVTVDFMPTKRVGDLVQVDERHRLVCLPHNRRIAGDVEAPEFIPMDEVRSCGISSVPKRSEDELASLAAAGGEGEMLESLTLWIRTSSEPKLHVVPLISSHVKTGGFAFRQSYGLATRAQTLLEQTCHDADRDPPTNG